MPSRTRAGTAARQVTSRAATQEPDPLFRPVVAAFAKDASVSQARMFGSVGLRAKGKVFAMLVKGELVVKLPKTRVDGLIASGRGKPFDPGHGRLMKEWLAVGLREKGSWVRLAREARTFVEATT